VAGFPNSAAEVDLHRGAPADKNDLPERGLPGKALHRICVPDPSNLPHIATAKVPRRALGERFLCKTG
jgi:hypothetical protein